MKLTSDRAAFASLRHQRGNQRNRSAGHGTSANSAYMGRRAPTQCPHNAMAPVRALFTHLDLALPTMLDDGEDHE
ncbi:hypothetical protein DIE14_33155 [Burkholderia sp. Bp9017]|uniref:Uncharacterized protein n=1 Tax=Burkholderia anthina TaxID=179879 RepID=A0A7T7AK00_9BURK|nr:MULTISPECIES: hypothetical protein [Burkholderia]QQK05187.1 hypothetical protein JFN94_28270 [Burkholderia anthina]RQZ15917.1 hypothetical protein DIE14_33155 [Burkholderia sp. Bp9017]RQZ27096.1 hypothetical protein DIE13_29680 [Burkholderia sp. Bp9016]